MSRAPTGGRISRQSRRLIVALLVALVAVSASAVVTTALDAGAPGGSLVPAESADVGTEGSTGEVAGASTNESFEIAGVYENVSAVPDDPVALDGSGIPEVPRDEYVVQVNVTTLMGGEDGVPVNDSATLHVPDVNTSLDAALEEERYNVTGYWLDETRGQMTGDADGEYVVEASNAPDNQTVVFYTGEDGQASVFYVTDRSDRTLEVLNRTATPRTEPVSDVDPDRPGDQTGVFGELTFNSSATNGRAVRFVGVVGPQSGQVSGIVTNERQEPVIGAVTYTEEVDFPGDLSVTFTPVYRGDRTPASLAQDGAFELTLYENDQEVRTATVAADRLRVGGPGYDFEDFPRIQPNGSFTFWTESQPDPTQGVYTLPDLPVLPGDDPTEYAIRSEITVETDEGTANLTGGAGIATTNQSTGTANVVLSGLPDDDLTAVYRVSELDPANASIAVDPDDPATTTVELSVTVENVGGRAGVQTVGLELREESGSTSTVDTREVELDVGDSSTVEFDLSGSDLLAALGENASEVGAGDVVEFVHVVSSDDDEASGNLSVEFVGDTGGVDVTGDGQPSTDLGEAFPGRHEDVTGDGEFSIADVQALFANREEDVVRDNPALFDYTADGSVGIGDVQALFAALQGD